ncbi:NAD(P)H-hydrate epimerase [Brachybacterium nesterenkovii]|uniref:NAD(P)H-hydrate epimerase n=1 Tax=Brachybacterium nesterenkovii TaxID=47847 RepID=UPI00321A4511
MIRAHTADAVRAAEQPLLAAGMPLMQRAAAALAVVQARLLRESTGGVSGRRVVILAGPGSNGGDALHAGARLARRGVGVVAIATAARLHGEGAEALRGAGGRILRLAALDAAGIERELARAHQICDGVLGIGGRAELDEPLAALLRAASAALAPVVAVDVPTGVDATTGEADPAAVRAAVTVTFGAVKAGLLMPGAAAHAGRIELVDIGLTPHLPERPAALRLVDEDVRALWLVPGPADHKYSRGVVALDVGSPAFPGAAVLAAEGAARAGAGMVRYRGPAAVRDLVLARRPEVVGADGRRQALVVGSGLESDDPRCRAGVEELLLAAGHRELLLADGRRELIDDAAGVIDAGALAAIRPGDRFGTRVVLTPHAGEAARLAAALGLREDLPAPRLATALAEETGATVLLKGAVTLVADGEDPAQLTSQADATPWLATAGAGDVLAGILGTLLAAGLPGARAGGLAALLHGRAACDASRGGRAPLVALDVAEHLPGALASILDDALRPDAPRGGA